MLIGQRKTAFQAEGPTLGKTYGKEQRQADRQTGSVQLNWQPLLIHHKSLNPSSTSKSEDKGVFWVHQKFLWVDGI